MPDRSRLALDAMNEITIRAEIEADRPALRDLIVEVFHQTFGSGEAEANLVEQLRDQSKCGPNLSLVAVIGGELAGHAFFSGVRLEEHPETKACTLAPLGVFSRFQRQGVGTRLIEQGLAECRDLGYRVVHVQGSLEYYPRFGFIPVAQTRLHTIFRSDHDMIIDLETGLLDRLTGLVAFPAPFHLFL